MKKPGCKIIADRAIFFVPMVLPAPGEQILRLSIHRPDTGSIIVSRRSLMFNPIRPLGGRTRLAVNQGTRKQHEDLCHEWGQHGELTGQPNGINDEKGPRVPVVTNEGKGRRYV